MAAIDKIYGTDEEYDEFFNWIEMNKPELKIHFYLRDGYSKNYDRPITNLPESADKWLLKNCPIKWVVDRINEQYGKGEIHGRGKRREKNIIRPKFNRKRSNMA